MKTLPFSLSRQVSITVHRYALLLAFVLALAACTNKQPDPSLKPEMRAAAKSVWELYSYVWDDSSFKDPKSAKTISKLIQQLSDHFHRIEQKAPIEMFEPGFTVTLVAQQEALWDIRRRFESGSKEYAQWRLRNIAQNCISCHSRFNVPSDFFAIPPNSPRNTFDSGFSESQFLFATRQFDKASHQLLESAKSVALLPSGSAKAFRALQLWLVIEVRVKDRYQTSASELEKILSSGAFAHTEAEAIRTWISDLNILRQNSAAAGVDFERARKLLETVGKAEAIDENNIHLVKSLYASSILHTLLLSKQTPDDRRRASYQLALAYTHMPIQSFEGFGELYLEQCIREFPATQEAKQAFEVYKEAIEEGSTGSGGLHLDENDARKLAELRNLAYGTARPEKVEEPVPGVF